MKIFREIVTLLVTLPDRLAAALDRWVLHLHSPVPIEHRGLVCSWCRQDWPCADTARVVDRHPEWATW